MNRIFQLFGSSLVRPRQPSWVSYKIDLHIAAGRNVPRLLVVSERIAVNLVEAGGIAPIKNNADVAQFGVSVKLELLHVARLDGKQRPLAVRLGKLKAVR